MLHTNMNLTENIRLAFGSLLANKLRAILTMLGIIIGVAAVITLVSVGEGVQDVVISEFEGLGNNLLFVTPGRPDANQMTGFSGGVDLTNDDYQALADPFNVPDLARVAPLYDRPALITRGKQRASGDRHRHDARLHRRARLLPRAGRFLHRAGRDLGRARGRVGPERLRASSFPTAICPSARPSASTTSTFASSA